MLNCRAHEQFGYCQAGTSGVLTPSGSEYVVIGTPGPYTWRGTVYVVSVSDDFIQKDTVVYNSPMQEDSPVYKYSYLGEYYYYERRCGPPWFNGLIAP